MTLFRIVNGEAVALTDDEVSAREQTTLTPQLPDLLPYQFRSMLALSGKADGLAACLETLPEPQRTIARAKLDYSLVFRRNNDLVETARLALGLSDTDLDALWKQASAIL